MLLARLVISASKCGAVPARIYVQVFDMREEQELRRRIVRQRELSF